MHLGSTAALAAPLLAQPAVAQSLKYPPPRNWTSPQWGPPSWGPPSYGPPKYNPTGSRRADAVREAFLFAWDNYYQYAFPNDEIQPVNKSTSNPRNGWGASAIDALSTAIVMEIPQVVNQIITYVPHINYGASYMDEPVSLFETTIRYLGGMLSGYDFLSGPLAYLAWDKDNVKALLTQSENLANYLSYAFDTPSGVPTNNLFFGNRSDDGSETNGLATIGSLVLEWTHLSDLTGNQTYAKLSQKGESYLLNPSPPADVPFPGLLGTDVNITTGKFVDGIGGWIGGDDSYYEYLIKMYVYDSKKFGAYRDHWITAADSTMKYLASHPSSRPDLTFLAEYNFTRLIYTSEHLACFDGGNFLLGGAVLGRRDYIDFGLKLTSACHDTYTSTATRIGPEVFSWNTTALPANQTAFYRRNGFYITNPIYDLRPEVIESYYYAYQITHDPKYQDWAWDAFVAINATCRVRYGFSAIKDVNVPGGGGFSNDQESFLFAEVLKYAFLIQAPQRPWDVNFRGSNEWVYNTEAHPFRVHGPPV